MLPTDEFEQFDSRVIKEDNTDVLKTLVRAVNELQKKVNLLETSPQDNVEIKTDTGDYAAGNSWDGRRVINTADNTYKIFAESAWRQIVNW